MSAPLTQPSFIGGELATSLKGRNDLARYAQSLELCENFVVDPHGGVSNRPGTAYHAKTKAQDGTYVRLIPFRPSSDESYMLELGAGYLRIHTQYGPVYSTVKILKTANHATPDSTEFLTTDAGISTRGLYRAQSFVSDDGSGFVLANVGVFLMKTGVSDPSQVSVAIYTDSAGLPGAAVTGLDFANWSRPAPADLPLNADTEGAYAKFYPLNDVTLAPGTRYHVVVSAPSGDGTAMNLINATTANAYSAGGASYYDGSWHAVTDLDLCFEVYGAPEGLVDLVTPYASGPFADDGTETDLHQLVYTQSVDVMTITHNPQAGPSRYPVCELKRYGEGDWRFAPIAVDKSVGDPESIEITTPVPPGDQTKLWAYQVAGVSRDGVESAAVQAYEAGNPDAEVHVGFVDGSKYVRLTITPGLPVDHYAVYKGRNDTYGFIGVTKMAADLTELWDATYNREYAAAYSELQGRQVRSPAYQHRDDGRRTTRDARDNNSELALQADAIARQKADAAVAAARTAAGISNAFVFDDENFAPDYTDQPRRFINPFAVQSDGSYGRFPKCVCYFQQRRVYANWEVHPNTIAMSEVGDFGNFQRSIPTVDDDSIEATLASGLLNDIRAMLPLGGALFLFTSAAEFILSAERGPVTPSNIDSRPISGRGSGTLQPLVVGNVILFKDRGDHIREWLFDFNSNDYPATDVGLLASHLFDNQTIMDWAYAAAPRSVVWAIRSDGMLLSFTYVREQNVAAWARHTTGLLAAEPTIRAAEALVKPAVVDLPLVNPNAI